MQLPEYRIVATQTFGHFQGPFQSGLRNAPIPTANLPEEIHKFATTLHFPQSIRELEAMTESKKEDTIRFAWAADLVTPIADQIYEDMICVQAWKVVSVAQIEGIIDTVRNRLLKFILEIEEIDSGAGEDDRDVAKITPEKVTQVFNNYILGNNNVVGAGTNVNQSVHQTIMQGNFQSLAAALKELGLEDHDINDLANAIKQDGARTKKEGVGQNVKAWIGKMVQKIVSGAWNIAIETAPLLLSNAISHYYGWS